MPEDKKHLKLGEILIKENIISKSQLEKAISLQKQEGGRLGEILVKLGMLKEDQIVAVLGKQLNIPYFSSGTDLKPALDQNLDQLILKEFALKYTVIPLSRTLNSVTIAMFDPFDLILIDNLRKITGCEINPVMATKSDITRAIERFYGKLRMFEDAVEASYDIPKDLSITETKDITEQELSLDKLIASAEEAPVIKLVDLIIRQAIDERASDIHIEPFKDKISIRYRIDGILYEIPPPASHLHLAIISRIKILSKLDIAEKRLPQDGSFLVKLEDRPIDLRVSTIPTLYGEKIVLRILDKKSVILDLNLMGFDEAQLQQIRSVINLPYGLVLLTGPTGSGKTTTLYAILNEIKNSTKNIITAEDPVEYKLDGINQVQIKPEIGLTFANALRSFLRQDPDIILVGEIRDLETAQICIRAALTGHLVLSTLHTNDAPSAIARLIDIGIEPYMVAPSLLLVVAQRLARKLCPDCKKAYETSSEKLGGVKINSDLIYKPQGCNKCGQIGYRGRTCISEVMNINDNLRELIGKNLSYVQLKEAARSAGMQTLFESAVKKVEEGIISLEEAFSTTMGVG
ncbi:MAG: type II secretion system protein GspE [Candidatus Omnitrophota bacterium]|nr:MAG: type II secretion system protein GspE [Candidatus Omnitrophota bacterium]